MRKAFVIMFTLAAMSTTAFAGIHIDSINYVNTKFNQNWFIFADGSINWWQGSDQNPLGNYTAVQWGSPSLGGSIGFGKWINHKFGFRVAYDVNRGKSYIDGLHVKLPKLNFLFDGTFTYDENGNFVSYNGSDPDENGYYNTSFMFHNIHADVIFSPIDFFLGYYNPNRIYTPIFYAGMGLATVGNDFLLTKSLLNNYKNKNDEFAQNGINTEYSLDFGLINSFKMGDHLELFLDLKWSMMRWNIDTWFCETGGLANYDVTLPTDGVRPKKFDNNYSACLGIAYNFSKTYELPNNCNEEMEEMRTRIKTLEDDMANMNTNTVYDPDAVVHDTIIQFVNTHTEDVISYPFSIFFERDSYQLMSKRDIQNLREIAEVAKKNGYKIRLRGSADSATATAAYNQTLSENRCRKIMIELLEMGIPESQIILVPVGGVSELNPAELDRRVLVELVKEAQK